MQEMELRFTGSVPASYERLMVPLIFQPYADELARRAQALKPRRILETAAGTGVVTRALHRALPDAEIVATDLNQPMLDVAQTSFVQTNVHFQQADALELPFEDERFDLVVCQFGSMFFPDKVRGHSEARRVLRDGGHYLLAIWDEIEPQRAQRRGSAGAHRRCFPTIRRMFMCEGPFGYSDPVRIERDLRDAGFRRDRNRDGRAEQPEPLCARCGRGALLTDRRWALSSRTGRREPRPRFSTMSSKPCATFEGPDGIDAPDVSAHRDRD